MTRLLRPFLTALAAALLPTVAAAQGLLHVTPGGAPGEQLGETAAFAGDVNGDGFSDLLAGAPRTTVYGASDGDVRVVSGLDGALLLTVTGAFGDVFGHDLAGRFDLDGDGRVDWIAGAPQVSEVGAGSVGPGYARVTSGATGAPLLTIAGSPGDGLGAAVDAGADVDLDGVPDLIVGARQESLLLLQPGYARVVSGATGAVLSTFPGPSPLSRYGQEVRWLGDADGDGVPDLAVGGLGVVDVRSGATGAVLSQVTGGVLEGVGQAVAAIGDLDGDGLADLVVASSGSDVGAPDGGALLGRRGFDGASLWTAAGAAANGWLGAQLGAAADLDGDGVDDVLAAGISFRATAPPVELRSGATGALLGSIAPPPGLGQAVGGLDGRGDVNGDGVPDLLIGTPRSDEATPNAGAVSVWSSSCGAVSVTLPACPPGALSLSVGGCAVGGGTVDLVLGGGVPLSTVLLFAGASPGAVPLPGGCMLGAGGAPVVVPLPLDATGGLELSVPLPSPAPTAVAHVQALAPSPTAPGGLLASAAVAVALP